MADKKVVVDVTFTMLMSVSENWGKQDVEFWLNDSSHCLANEIITLQEEENRAEEGTCFTCNRANAVYVRDALDSDIENLTPPTQG